MKRHRFDMVSFLAGVILLALSVPFLFSDVAFRPAQGRWIVPGILVIAGVVMLSAGRDRDGAEVPARVDPDPAAFDDHVGDGGTAP